MQFQEVDVERDLDELQYQIGNDQYDPKSTNFNEFVYFYNRTKDNSNRKFLDIPGKYDQFEEYKITVFVVNRLNKVRKVTRKSINGTNIYDVALGIYKMLRMYH